MAEDNKQYFMIIAIVAIVAIVALVILIGGKGKQQNAPIVYTATGDNLGGQATAVKARPVINTKSLEVESQKGGRPVIAAPGYHFEVRDSIEYFEPGVDLDNVGKSKCTPSCCGEKTIWGVGTMCVTSSSCPVCTLNPGYSGSYEDGPTESDIYGALIAGERVTFDCNRFNIRFPDDAKYEMMDNSMIVSYSGPQGGEIDLAITCACSSGSASGCNPYETTIGGGSVGCVFASPCTACGSSVIIISGFPWLE